MSKSVLYLMLGYPGAGKTTAAQLIHRLTGAVHLWADHERQKLFPKPAHTQVESLKLYEMLNERAAELLAAGQSVVFDTNFGLFKDRQHLRQIAAQNGAEARLIWVKTPKDMAKDRATHLNQAQRNTYDEAMPSTRFERISQDLEPPRPDEAYIELDGTKITAADVQKALEL